MKFYRTKLLKLIYMYIYIYYIYIYILIILKKNLGALSKNGCVPGYIVSPLEYCAWQIPFMHIEGQFYPNCWLYRH